MSHFEGDRSRYRGRKRRDFHKTLPRREAPHTPSAKMTRIVSLLPLLALASTALAEQFYWGRDASWYGKLGSLRTFPALHYSAKPPMLPCSVAYVRARRSARWPAVGMRVEGIWWYCARRGGGRPHILHAVRTKALELPRNPNHDSFPARACSCRQRAGLVLPTGKAAWPRATKTSSSA